MKNRRTSIGVWGVASCMLMWSPTSGDIVSGVDQGEFGAAVVEVFQDAYVQIGFYDFRNGMVYGNLVGQADHINLTRNYGMGNGPTVHGGLEGAGDGYFGTDTTPTTFELSFAGGITHFGFYGAESHLDDGSLGRNGELDMVFYDTNDNLVGSIAELTPPDTHAWEQWHGFTTDDGTLIGRIVFEGVGHMVLDNVSFVVPVPGASACPWDLNGDGIVDVDDLLEVVHNFGPCDGECPADFDEDGFVGASDLVALISNFGECPGTGCPWDVNGDGVVDRLDVRAVNDNMGSCKDPDNCPWDVNGDGVVDGADVSEVATHFGPCPKE